MRKLIEVYISMIRNFILVVIAAITFFLWVISPTVNHNTLAATITYPENMALIQRGTFRIGSDDHYAEEKSANQVTVTDFCIDRHEVTNARFAKFVAETGYKTIAERPLSVEEFPTLKPEERKPGSLVFIPPEQGKTQVETLSWWHWVQGADWQHPQGQNSSIVGKENYPVVQIAFEDAQAYAKWAGKSLPSEAQWEYAARGGLSKMIYSWGNQYSAKKANTWQGQFPFFNTEEDGFTGLAPVGSFPANGYGLYDMTGNVWEWTEDWYHVGHEGKSGQKDPLVANKAESLDPREPGVAKHVIKGGSYLCAKNYCSRYRPAAREAEEPNTGTSHIGFRLAKNLPV
jgi:formylglycine-generating enzyme required for sulfatase activity